MATHFFFETEKMIKIKVIRASFPLISAKETFSIASLAMTSVGVWVCVCTFTLRPSDEQWPEGRKH